jgi:hypothetical protein
MNIEECNTLRSLVSVEACATHSDHDIYRFLVARNHNLKKAAAMLSEELKWRHTPIKGHEDCTPANVLSNPLLGNESHWKEHFPFSYLGHDKDGCPIYWEKTGEISSRFHIGKKFTTEDQMVWHHILKQEFVMHTSLPHASKFYGREVTKQVVVLDLKHLSYAIDSMAMNYVLRSLAIDQAYYPERLKHFFIVNAPWFFQGIWTIIHPFLDTVTANKILILGSDYLPKLRESIDDSQIPVEMGGSRANFTWNSNPREIDSDEYCARAIPGHTFSLTAASSAHAPLETAKSNSVVPPTIPVTDNHHIEPSHNPL